MSEPSRPSGDRRGTVALVFASLSLVLSLLSCGVVVVTADPDLSPVRSEPATAATASQVEAVARVTLPPGTVLLSAAYANGLDTRLSAKFRIPRATVDAFVASGGFTAALTPGLRAVTGQHDVGEGNLWHPERAVTVAGIEEQQPTSDGTLRRLLLDLDDRDVVLVYLYASND